MPRSCDGPAPSDRFLRGYSSQEAIGRSDWPTRGDSVCLLTRRGARVDESGDRLYQILGTPPSLIEPPTGCRFAARCEYAQDLCRAEYPDLREIGVEHSVACHFADRGDWTPELDPADFSATEVIEA